jgi:hypothetical protein
MMSQYFKEIIGRTILISDHDVSKFNYLIR